MKIQKKLFFIVFFTINMFSSESILNEIKAKNKIKVCVWPEYYGISFLDQRTQQFSGIDSDLARELAKDLNVNLEFIPSSFVTLIDDINNNVCNIAMFAIGNTAQRREKIRFTTAHLSSDVYAITTKNNKRIQNWDDLDKKGNIIAVAKGTYHEAIMKEKLKNADLLILDKMHQREEEVQAGRADAFMTDYPFAKRMLAKTDWAKLIEPKSTYFKTDYSWAIKYGDDEFYNRVEKFIKDIKEDGRLLSFAKKNALEPIVKLK
jgi:polar amino acid transport system substrate-binding protein